MEAKPQPTSDARQLRRTLTKRGALAGLWQASVTTPHVTEAQCSMATSCVTPSWSIVRSGIHYRNPGLCRVLAALPSAFYRALGKDLRSVKVLFTECGTLGTARHSAKMALGKGPLAAVYSWQSSVFVECQISGTRQRESLPSVLCRHSAKHIFIFYFGHQTFCGMFLHYVDLYVLFWDNYDSVFYS
jgi:hypothetical protein